MRRAAEAAKEEREVLERKVEEGRAALEAAKKRAALSESKRAEAVQELAEQ